MIDLIGSLREQREGQAAFRPDMCKTLSDVARYAALLDETRPNVLVELGSWTGATAQWFAERGVPNVISIDVEPQAHNRYRDRFARVTYLVGSSIDPNMVGRAFTVAMRAPHVRRMVVCDSDHSAAHVLAEMELWGEWVTPGCYLVVEDTITAHMTPRGAGYDGSPLDAVEEYQRRHSGRFMLDENLEDRWPTTQSPGGWLKRMGP